MCSKDVQIAVVSSDRDVQEFEEFKKMLFQTDTFMSAKSEWEQLFGSDVVVKTFPTISEKLQDLVAVIRGPGLYKNGAVKFVLYHLMRMGSDEGKVGNESFFVRTSTTTDPTTDACGLKCSSHVCKQKREDALNGKHIQ